MGQKSNPRRLGDNEALAVAAMLRGSPQKLNLVAASIRGMKVEKALTALEFSPKKAAHIVKKVLDSAIANAENNEGADVDELKISSIFVDEGTTMKRLRPRAKGRADRIFNTAVKSVEEQLGDTGRVILRPSGTEPLIRVTLEGTDETQVARLAEELANVVRAELA